MSAFFSILKNLPLRRHVGICLLSFLSCLIFLAVSDPSRISLAFLLVPFILCGIFVHELIYLFLVGFARRQTFVFKRVAPLSGAFFLVIILLLQSLNQLGIKDVLIILVLMIVFWLYLWRADFLNK